MPFTITSEYYLVDLEDTIEAVILDKSIAEDNHVAAGSSADVAEAEVAQGHDSRCAGNGVDAVPLGRGLAAVGTDEIIVALAKACNGKKDKLEIRSKGIFFLQKSNHDFSFTYMYARIFPKN